jgi:hypothetical protein
MFIMSPKSIMEGIMHNLISYNQLAGWRQSVERLSTTLDEAIEESDALNDYYNCLIDCDENQAFCKRICRSILD